MAIRNPENNQQGRRRDSGVHRPRCSSVSFLAPKCQNHKERNGKLQVRDAAAEAAGTGGWEGTERLPKPRQEERTSTDATTYLHTPLTFHLLVLVSACPTEHTRHLIMLQVEILPAFKDLLKYNLFRLKPFFSLTGYDFLWRLIIF